MMNEHKSIISSAYITTKVGLWNDMHTLSLNVLNIISNK